MSYSTAQSNIQKLKENAQSHNELLYKRNAGIATITKSCATYIYCFIIFGNPPNRGIML